MIRLNVKIRWGPWKWQLLLLAGLAAIVLAAAAYAARSTSAAQEAPTAYLPAGEGRHYYLTDFSVVPSNAKTSCTAGYHMASLWEIYDTSNLKYDTNHPDAYSKTDSGKGPPSHWYGWIRTGFDSATNATAGIGNCSNWTQNTTGSGTIARLNYDWDVSVSAVDLWEPDPWACTGNVPVWCVGDTFTIQVPLVRK